ncbi:hypothetical protein IVA94_22370 [Bradyrhizobium sp. 156]|uniref:hypothetical protein n=1 Tax=Bradyrhizobium sp. 156 TaxID=2782630 RepID=UPI001FF82C10|nr:hypothetical protein [Bradyrhizobium sp. 156]MCK1323592.1 hypothetical protein [Bradyrhizobium sp. 156]
MIGHLRILAHLKPITLSAEAERSAGIVGQRKVNSSTSSPESGMPSAADLTNDFDQTAKRSTATIRQKSKMIATGVRHRLRTTQRVELGSFGDIPSCSTRNTRGAK